MQNLSEIFIRSKGVCTDSRNVSAGQIFFALRGENFDGNLFAQKALQEGALCAVVERGSEIAQNEELVRSGKLFLCDSPLKELQSLARWYRSQFDIPVIALTGTNGKTTTKELITAVLSKKYTTSATSGNLNNSIGVPLSLFKMDSSTQIAVIEMGASHPGDIKELVDIALPNFGLVTNVGKAHLLGFGSFEGVKKTKGELYDFLVQNGGIAFLNGDNQYLCEMAESRAGLETVKYGLDCQGFEIMPVTMDNPFLRIVLPYMEQKTLTTHLVGAYNADNVITALAVGNYFGVSLEDACSAIEEYIPSNSRSELRRTENNLLVVDAYNANPTSMKASLENFESTLFENKMLMLGDMRELGEYSRKEHRTIFDLAMKMNVGRVFFVGSEFMNFKEEKTPKTIQTQFFENVEELKRSIALEPLKGKTILIKGSNGIHLQSIVPLL